MAEKTKAQLEQELAVSASRLGKAEEQVQDLQTQNNDLNARNDKLNDTIDKLKAENRKLKNDKGESSQAPEKKSESKKPEFRTFEVDGARLQLPTGKRFFVRGKWRTTEEITNTDVAVLQSQGLKAIRKV